MRISDWCADVCSSYLPKWLRGLGADPRALSIIRVAGDSMAPTLIDGDDILVDGGDAAGRLRDGIYVLRMDDALMVKRIARAPGPGRSEEHTSELQSLMRISYAVFCLNKKIKRS